MKKTRIVIAGMGEIGGYFAAMLSKQYRNSLSIEVCFLVQTNSLYEIAQKGIRFIEKNEQHVVFPHVVSTSSTEIGIADILLICTRSYELQKVLQQIKLCVNKDTIIFPLLNGVDVKEKVVSIFKRNLVVDACMYVVSRINRMGIVENLGQLQTLYFGHSNFNVDALKYIQKLFTDANINAILVPNAANLVWERFIFLSPIATITAFSNLCIGEVLDSKEHSIELLELAGELIHLARIKGIHLQRNVLEITINKLRTLPYETTTTLHLDSRKSNLQWELESLTGYVVKEAKKLSVDTPVYKKMYLEMKKEMRLRIKKMKNYKMEMNSTSYAK